jgi:hypothetical protein
MSGRGCPLPAEGTTSSCPAGGKGMPHDSWTPGGDPGVSVIDQLASCSSALLVANGSGLVQDSLLHTRSGTLTVHAHDNVCEPKTHMQT